MLQKLDLKMNLGADSVHFTLYLWIKNKNMSKEFNMEDELLKKNDVTGDLFQSKERLLKLFQDERNNPEFSKFVLRVLSTTVTTQSLPREDDAISEPLHKKRRYKPRQSKEPFDETKHVKCDICNTHYTKKNISRHNKLYHDEANQERGRSVSRSSSLNSMPNSSTLESLASSSSSSSSSSSVATSTSLSIQVLYPPFTAKLRESSGSPDNDGSSSSSRRFRSMYKRPIFLSEIMKQELKRYFEGVSQSKTPGEISQITLTIGRFLHFVKEQQVLNQVESLSSLLETFERTKNQIMIVNTTQSSFWGFVKESFLFHPNLVMYLDELRDLANFKPTSMLNETERLIMALCFIKANVSAEPLMFLQLNQTEEFLRGISKTLRKLKRKHMNTLTVDFYESMHAWTSFENLLKTVKSMYNTILGRLKEFLKEQSSNPSAIFPDIEFTRGYVVSFWLLENRPVRSGNFSCLSVSDIQNAFEIQEKKGEVAALVTFDKFKTSAKYGYQSLAISSDVKELIRLYIRVLNLEGDSILFPHVSKSVSIFWWRQSKLHINVTRIRSIIQTEATQLLSIENQEYLSRGQCHSSEVARNHYVKLKSKHVCEKADKAYELLKSFFK